MPPEDAHAILAIIGSRNGEQCEIESQRKYKIDLMRVRLHGWVHGTYWVHGARDPTALLNFSNVNFPLADLRKASIHSAVTFADSFFFKANLSGAVFVKADFSNAHLNDADLSDATLMKVSMLSSGMILSGY